MPISCIIGMHFANYLIRCLADPKLNFEHKYELFSLIFFCELQPICKGEVKSASRIVLSTSMYYALYYVQYVVRISNKDFFFLAFIPGIFTSGFYLCLTTDDYIQLGALL